MLLVFNILELSSSVDEFLSDFLVNVIWRVRTQFNNVYV